MTRDIIEVNNFTILVEQSNAKQEIIERCGFDDQVIGFSFYGSGNVSLDINYRDKTRTYHNTKGIALSFCADKQVEFVHNISSEKPLQCICILSSIEKMRGLPEAEAEMFNSYIHELVYPQDNYVEGPGFHMSPDMLAAVDKIFQTSYKGAAKMMFIRSQIIELLAHFFALVSNLHTHTIKDPDREKLYHVKEILADKMEAPPSLQELSKLVGLNSYKLKKNFKALFGVPVFKYLQNERLTKAHELLRTGDMSIQEAAWEVGYESLSSFSSAFLKKFGFRPSEIRNNPS